MGCEKCDYTGFAYGKIPCMCVVDAPPSPPKEDGTIFVDHSKYRPHINGVPLQPTGNDIDIDNQYKPDLDGENGYGCLNLTFPAQDRDFQIMKVSGKGQIINIGESVFYDNMFVGRALDSAQVGEPVKILIDGATYMIDSNDPMLQFGKPTVERCTKCGHKLD